MLAQKKGAFTLMLYYHTDNPEVIGGNSWGPLGFIVRDCAVSHAALHTMGANEVRGREKSRAMSVSFLSDPEGYEIEFLQLPTTAGSFRSLP